MDHGGSMSIQLTGSTKSLRDATSIRDFGAVGKSQGSLDDSAVILAAVASIEAAAIPKALYFPADTYHLTQQAKMELAGIEWFGDGEGPTIMNVDTVSAAIKFGAAAIGGRIRDMRVIASATTPIAIELAAEESVAERVKGSGGVEGIKCTGVGSRTRWGSWLESSSNGYNYIADKCVGFMPRAKRCGNAATTAEGGIKVNNAVKVKLYFPEAEECATHGIYANNAEKLLISHPTCNGNGKLSKELAEPRSGRGITITGTSHFTRLVTIGTNENYECGVYIGPPESEILGVTVAGITSLNNNKGEFPGGHGCEHDGIGGYIDDFNCRGNNCGISLNGAAVVIGTGEACENKKGGEAIKGHGLQFNHTVEGKGGRHVISASARFYKNAGKGILGSSAVNQPPVVISGGQSYENTEANVEVSNKYEGSIINSVPGVTDSPTVDERLAVASPTALAPRAEATDFEPSATRPTIVTGYLEGKTITKTKIKILVDGVIVNNAIISATSVGNTVYPLCFVVPAGKKWRWEKTEGEVEALKSSYSVL